MLARLRRLNPGDSHHVGHMRTVRLGETFDAVLVHDAISYMTSEADRLSVLETARAHLRPGGLLIVAPDYYTETFETNHDAETELTFVEDSADLDPVDTTIESTYVFFIKRGGELQVEVGSHTTGLFPISTWGHLLAEARFEVERVDYPVSKDGRPMFLWVGQDDSW